MNSTLYNTYKYFILCYMIAQVTDKYRMFFHLSDICVLIQMGMRNMLQKKKKKPFINQATT